MACVRLVHKARAVSASFASAIALKACGLLARLKLLVGATCNWQVANVSSLYVEADIYGTLTKRNTIWHRCLFATSE